MKRKSKIVFHITVCLAMVAMLLLTPLSAQAANKKIKLIKNSATLSVGQTTIISAKSYQYSTKLLKFQSKNKKIATVNSKGKVTAKKAGKTEITVSLRAKKSVKATFKVTVTKSVPYMKKNKLNFSSYKKTYTVPGIAYPITPNGEFDSGSTAVFDPFNMRYKISYMYRSLPDSKNYVTTTIIYDEVSNEIRYTGDCNKVSIWGRSFSLYDYYTGVHLPSRSTHGNDSFTTETKIKWNNKTYKISISQNVSNLWNGGFTINNDGSRSSGLAKSITFNVKAPADYDGIVMVMPKKGLTMEDALSFNKSASEGTIKTDNKKLLDVMGKKDAWCIRINTDFNSAYNSYSGLY